MLMYVTCDSSSSHEACCGGAIRSEIAIIYLLFGYFGARSDATDSKISLHQINNS
jgi:hypothetical protein